MTDTACSERARILELEEENARLRSELESRDEVIRTLQERIKELTRRTNMNSQNSSKPPSTDGLRRPNPRSLRVRSGKRPGGQPGHEGHNIVIPHEPDVVVDHYPEECIGCPRLAECHSSNVFSCAESRFVIEAVMRTEVTEHRRMVAECPYDASGREPVSGSLPEKLKAHVQYGDTITAVVGLLDTYGAVSDLRISRLICSFFGVSLSPGTVVNMTSRCADKIAPTLDEIRKKIIASKVNHFDETGARVNGKLNWVHLASNPMFTIQTISQRRGTDGIDENKVLPVFEGVSVHDCWDPYWKYANSKHAVCCAHLLRELNGIEELEPGHTWPGRFKHLLLDMKAAKERAIAQGKPCLSDRQLRRYSIRYDDIMACASDESPKPQIRQGKRGRHLKRGPESSLVYRLQTHKDSVCMFLHDFDVPFDNNQAERDFRNVKTKMKVSGCFRSSESAQDYLNIMSYLSTARKQGIDMFEAMVAIFEDRSHIVL